MTLDDALKEIEGRATQALKDDWDRGLPTSFLDDSVKDDIPRLVAALKYAVTCSASGFCDTKGVVALLRGESVKA